MRQVALERPLGAEAASRPLIRSAADARRGRPARSAAPLRTGLGQLPRHLALQVSIAQLSLPSNATCATPSSERANMSVDTKHSGSAVSPAVPRCARGPEPVKTQIVRSDRRCELVAGGAMAEVANQNADAIGVSRWRSCMSRGTASTVVIAALQRAIDSILPRWPSARHRPIVVISVRDLVEAGLLPVSVLALWR